MFRRSWKSRLKWAYKHGRYEVTFLRDALEKAHAHRLPANSPFEMSEKEYEKAKKWLTKKGGYLVHSDRGFDKPADPLKDIGIREILTSAAPVGPVKLSPVQRVFYTERGCKGITPPPASQQIAKLKAIEESIDAWLFDLSDNTKFDYVAFGEMIKRGEKLEYVAKEKSDVEKYVDSRKIDALQHMKEEVQTMLEEAKSSNRAELVDLYVKLQQKGNVYSYDGTVYFSDGDAFSDQALEESTIDFDLEKFGQGYPLEFLSLDVKERLLLHLANLRSQLTEEEKKQVDLKMKDLESYSYPDIDESCIFCKYRHCPYSKRARAYALRAAGHTRRAKTDFPLEGLQHLYFIPPRIFKPFVKLFEKIMKGIGIAFEGLMHLLQRHKSVKYILSNNWSIYDAYHRTCAKELDHVAHLSEPKTSYQYYIYDGVPQDSDVQMYN